MMIQYKPLSERILIIYSVLEACLVQEYILQKIHQNLINMFGVLVAEQVVPYIKIKVATCASAS